MFLLLICIAYSQEVIQVLTKQEAIVDVFDQSGIILEQDLTEQPLCEIRPQKLVATNIDENSITLINNFNDNSFSQSFEFGKFEGQIGKILKFVQIPNGVLVLTDSAQLFYLSYEEQTFKKRSIFSLDIFPGALQTRVFMEYFYISQQVILIFNQLTIGIDLEFDDDDLYIQQFRLYETLNTYHINSIATTGNIMVIAMDNGIKIYELQKRILNELSLNIEDIGNVQDVKIFNKKNQDYYQIYLLIKQRGVQTFTYKSGTQTLNFNSKLGTIPYSGEILDVFGDILMVVESTTLYEFNINQNTYTLIKQHQLETEIIDINLTEMFAIVIGRNGHQIIFHSIPSSALQFEWMNQLVIPNLKQLDILGLNFDLQLNQTKKQSNHRTILGITQHKFFYSHIDLQQSALVCYSDNQTDLFQITYHQKSTLCPTKSKKEECNFAKNYTLQFIEPQQFGGNRSTYLQLILFYILAIVSFILLMIFLIKQYKQYQRSDSNNVTQNMKTDVNQKHVPMQSDKCIPVSRDDQTPISEFRDQMNQQLNNNRPITQENIGDQSPVVSAFR